MKKNIQILLQAITLPMLCLILVFSAKATIHQVNVADFSFSPSSLPSVFVGDTVRWTWSGGSHTTTSTSVPTGASSWDNPMNSTNTSFDYKVTHVGTYNYQCSFHIASMAGSFTASEPLGVASTAKTAKDVSIYPNPFINSIHIDKKGSDYNEAIITDILGKKIISVNLNNKITIIDESNFPEIGSIPNGIYFVTLTNQNQNKNTIRIVKN
ncbi:MAG: T9SS type A sorting domain-containing protein [Bacteroidetes bacterium]|nr:T9SS type A sorting domain-containing protein [Bacteroidota bacterium]HET6244730.1 T9SS type A sorting domain-containing protein [Bacteroidia bacterium]